MSTVSQVVHVQLGPRSYDIHVGAGNIPEIATLVGKRGKIVHAILITDDNVRQPHAMKVAQTLAGADIRVDLISIPPGEQSKSVSLAAGLWNGLLELGADRKTLVVAVGGGVVGDLAGFVAATYARGLALFQVPTTLLAQVDSSVGGKVGVNLEGGKNMVGAFFQPLGVLIDAQTLQTLPAREYLSGLGEVVKYGVILDPQLFAHLEQNAPALRNRDPSVLVPIIARCCRLKADIVEQDELELSGLRAVLNYGHTFAHAFETLTGYTELLHGEAVAMGMMCAARLARQLGRIDQELVDRQQRLLESLGLPVAPPKLDPEDVLAAMRTDKKAQHGKLRFVLPTRLGHVELVSDVPAADVRRALRCDQ